MPARALKHDCSLTTKAFQSAEPTHCPPFLEIPANHTDVTAKREHRSASRRRVRQHTPALRLQPEARTPRLTAFGPLPCPSVQGSAPAFPQSAVKKLKETRGRGGDYDIFRRPSVPTARQLRTRCTDFWTCTTVIAFNAGSEFRLLMTVGATA